MEPRTEPDVAPATDIRRRRAVTAGAAALATLLVAVAFVWLDMSGTEPVVTPTTSSTTTLRGTTVATPSSTPSATTRVAAPTGDSDAPARTVTVDPAARLIARPDIPFLLGTTLHRASTTRSFPVDPTFEYIALADGRALLLDEFKGYEWDRLQLLDDRNRTVLMTTAQPTHFLWAVANEPGTRFVVMESPDVGMSDAVLTLHDSTGTEQLRRAGVLDRLRLVGIIGDRVFLRNAEQDGGTYIWDLGHNTVGRYAEWDVVSVNEPSGSAALVGPGEWGEPRCTLVADVRGPSPVPVSTTCGLFAPLEFSPDGRYLLGSRVEPEDPPFLPPAMVVDAETGRPVLVLDDPTPAVVGAAFLGDGSVGLSLLVSEGRAWSNTLVRCSLHGECARMVETVPAASSDEGPHARYQLVRD
jgi:hypothetical protein